MKKLMLMLTISAFWISCTETFRGNSPVHKEEEKKTERQPEPQQQRIGNNNQDLDVTPLDGEQFLEEQKLKPIEPTPQPDLKPDPQPKPEPIVLKPEEPKQPKQDTPNPAPPPPQNKPDAIPDNPDSFGLNGVEVPVYSVVNMETGFHATTPGMRFMLKDNQGKLISAAAMSLDAINEGRALDRRSRASYFPALTLKMTDAETDLEAAQAAQGKAKLSICMPSDVSAPLHKNMECRDATYQPMARQGIVARSGSKGGQMDRATQLMNEPVDFELDGENIRITRFNGYPDQLANLAVAHPLDLPNITRAQVGFSDLASPLVIDLNGDGKLGLIDAYSDHRVLFDLEATGKKIRVGWIKKTEGLLAYDVNGNGKIDSGAELFGNFSARASGEKFVFQNGFDALAQYDANGDGVIDHKDKIYAKLVVWQDLNQDGRSQRNELLTLKSLGIKSISLKFEEMKGKNGDFVSQDNNSLRYKSTVQTKSGKELDIIDVFFAKRQGISLAAFRKGL